VKEPDCYALLTPSKEKDEQGNFKSHTTLFVPKFEQAYKMWMYVKPLEKFESDYKVQKVLTTDDMEEYVNGGSGG